MSSSHYPTLASDASALGIIALASNKLAQWSADGTTALAVAKEQCLLFDANGTLVPMADKASNARYAVWCNVATRGKRTSVLASALRASVGVKGSGECRVIPGEAAAIRAIVTLTDAQASRVADIASAISPYVLAIATPVATPDATTVATPDATAVASKVKVNAAK